MIATRSRLACTHGLFVITAVMLSQGMLAPSVAAQSPAMQARRLIYADSAINAVALLKAAVQTGPDSAAYHVWLAAAYADIGSRSNFFAEILYVNRIRSELKRAIALDSTSIDAHSELSRFYLTAPSILGGSLSRAESESRKISAANPARSHGLLGYIAHHRGDLKTAEREMRAAIAAQPDSAWPYTGLAFLLGEEKRNDEAFVLWEKSVTVDSTFRESYFQMGLIGATTGTHLDQSALALEHYVANPPRRSDKHNIASAYNELGQVYEKQGRVNDARRAYGQAVTLSPGSKTYKASLKAVG